MAFLRKETKKSGTYLRIVQSYRDKDGKNRHRTLYNMGKAEDYSLQSLKKMGKILYELGGGLPESLEESPLKELSRYYYGFPLLIKRLLKVYNLNSLFDRISRNKNLEYSLTNSIILLISERLHDPVSKFASYQNQNDYLGIEKIQLHQIYRTLDHLEENQRVIKDLIYHKGRNLFNQSLDVVFYDLTTFYFESKKEDGFREKGFNKDGKIGTTTIVFGMLIDKNKNPVSYQVYRGRQYEGHTLSNALKELKEKYQIDKVICVADRAMMSQDNLDEVEGEGYEFIIGERLKNISKKKQQEILDISRYKQISLKKESTAEDITIKYYVTEYNDKKLICTYSENRAKRDRHLREEKIEQAKALLKNPSRLEGKARMHFIKKTTTSTYQLDADKIKESERFDGFLSIATNNNDLPVTELLDAYKNLYKIEQTFRTFKNYIETRPMFHWTEKRIMGHLCLCYLSYTLLNYLQQQLINKSIPQSEATIRKSLVSMQISLIKQESKEYYLRSNTNEGARELMKLLQIKELPDLIPKSEICKYL